MHAMRERRDTVLLEPGEYDLRIWYYQAYPTRYGLIFKTNNIGGDCPKDTLQSVKKEEKFVLNNSVLFESNEYTIKQEVIPELDSICNLINTYEPSLIRLSGHTDDLGSGDYNIALSEKRAQSIMKYVRHKSKKRTIKFVVNGFGEDSPLVPNDSQENRNINRRVEITVE